MYIDLAKIDENGIIIDDTVSFGNEYIKNTPIEHLDNVKVKGRAYYSITNEIVFDCEVTGSFVLLDSINLEPVDYPFNIEISEVLCENADDFSQKELKTLDIMDVLWQNIVLEVPIAFHKETNEEINMSGDGWELVMEEKKKIDPRLAPLLELLEEEGKE